MDGAQELKASDLIHASLCAKPFITFGTLDEVVRMVVLGNCQREAIVHVKG